MFEVLIKLELLNLPAYGGVFRNQRNAELEDRAFKLKIPYGLTFNWNIINRRKIKQNITRDIEVKNNLTIAGGWGDSGKRGLQELL